MSHLSNRPHRGVFTALSLAMLVTASSSQVLLANDGDAPTKNSTPTNTVHAAVLADAPVAFWSFDNAKDPGAPATRGSGADPSLTAKFVGAVDLKQQGPRPVSFPKFGVENLAIGFQGKKGYAKIADPGDSSPFDFVAGDAMTIEAWVMPDSLSDGQQVYVIGKGRTYNEGITNKENQSWALRLRGVKGRACLSFLFRDAEKPQGDAGYHRWTSSTGPEVDGQWHHVAVSYQFGDPQTMRGYVDGKEVLGGWDMGGPTVAAPVNDNDDVWIGSSMGGSAGSTFNGLIDEVALFRKLIPTERLAARYEYHPEEPGTNAADLANDLPLEESIVEIFEGIPARDSWNFKLPKAATMMFEQPSFAMVTLPNKYATGGIIDDLSNPLLTRIRLRHVVQPEESGATEILLRTKGAARLFIDGKLVGQTKFLNHNASGHEAVPELAVPAHPDLCPLAPGHQEVILKAVLDPGEHVFRLDAIVGGKELRPEIGEVCVAWRRGDEQFKILAGGSGPLTPLTETGWLSHSGQLEKEITDLNNANRRNAASRLDEYWKHRHEYAKEVVGKREQVLPPDGASDSIIDRFILATLKEKDILPETVVDDFEFLRRVSIDLIGVIPDRRSIEAFMSDQLPNRRARAIESLLQDPRWADNWVGYWQDVLAENPGILKPELNNTGPFRVWIHESLLDNKPFDRFVTELIQMEGSRYYGGPAGFSMATQNDVPFAEKANVIAQGFLGLDMKCARCHDAPYNPHKQSELFHMAAMLNRKSITVPNTSSVPQNTGGRKPHVTVTLQPGESVDGQWPFKSLVEQPLPDSLLTKSDDSRAQLAALVTSPHNDRFAKVIVNRLWKRYLGRGFVDPVESWHDAKPSHPELLDYLAYELVLHDYDIKHVTRLIVNSATYQRRTVMSDDPKAEIKLAHFAGTASRRMTAEQLVDSLFAIAGKNFESEMLTMDPEGRRPADTFLNLGVPAKSWEFTSLSNERDRPALALPMAQSVIDVLLAFGWRDSRPNPITNRESEPTVLQPLTLANGIAPSRIVRLSDDSRLTQLCLIDRPLDELISDLFVNIMSRAPTPHELQMFREELKDGYDTRKVDTANAPVTSNRRRRDAVSWSNHLSAEATKIKNDQERAVRAGDPPTNRLHANWRERAEDCIWALLNSPEFIFLP